MRITLGDDDTDVEVAPGTAASVIAAAARDLGHELPPAPFCGGMRLDPGHPAGSWPLLPGARLTRRPGRPCAPTRGPSLVVVAGPDAGATIEVAEGPVVVGRSADADLRLADPAASERHATVSPAPARSARGERAGPPEPLVARDQGSTNGTRRWRGPSARGGPRAHGLAVGDLLAVGDSLLAVTGPMGASDPRTAGEDATTRPPRRAGLAASAASGVALGAMTGRWWLALLGLAYPAVALAPGALRRLDPSPMPASWEALPSSPHVPEAGRLWRDVRSHRTAVAGDTPWAEGFARAVLLARGAAPPSSSWQESWMRWLPAAEPGDGPVMVVPRGEVPSWCEVVVEVDGSGAMVRHPGGVELLPVVRVSRETAESRARAAAAAGRDSIPAHVRSADLPSPDAAVDGSRRMAAAVGADAAGPVTLDLDAHGPHALVAGTTGSGKSALLESMVLALARDSSPADLSVAILDFKGGAGLRACLGLPHVVGTLTDLDGAQGRRALTALASELADRKRALAARGLSSFQEWETEGGAPPRLLVVADEYQELSAAYRDFVPDLARLAAQGRSLGLHLVLATQRPAGAVTPEIRANIGATLALRVASEAESRDLIGTGDAAELPREAPGRAILAIGAARRVFQAALPSTTRTPAVRMWGDRSVPERGGEDLAAQARRRWEAVPSPPRLWIEPLPERLDAGAGPPGEGGIWLGVVDLPVERRREDLWWDPAQGAAVIVGPSGSGRTGVLRAIASQARSRGWRPVWLPADPREAARTAALATRETGCLLLVDDADAAAADLAEVDRGAALDGLLRMVARGRVALALPASSPPRLAAGAAVRAVMTGTDGSEDSLWSVPRDLAGTTTPLPGRARVLSAGVWREAQLACADERADEPLVRALPAEVHGAGLPAPTSPGMAVVGVGGDQSEAWEVPRDRPVLVVGEGTAAREAAASLAASLDGGAPGVRRHPSALAVDRDSLESATVVLAPPSSRAVRDALGEDAPGLVDPRALPLRVVIVADGRANAVQLAVRA